MEVTAGDGDHGETRSRPFIHRIAAAHVPTAAELDDADDVEDEPGAGDPAHAPPVNPEGSIKSARGRRIWTIKSTLVLRGNGAILLHYNSFAPPLHASSAQPAQPVTGPLGQ